MHRGIALESLEGRRFFSVQLATEPAGPVLRITGSEAADVYRVSQIGTTLYVAENGVQTQWDAGSLARIDAQLGAGDDRFEVTGGGFLFADVGIPMVINGDAGNDVLRGGAGADRISGGFGNDRIDGGAGGDVLYGRYEASADWLALLILPDDDVIRGGAGGDTLYGQSGCDDLYGGADNDALDGGNGVDGLYGGDGADVLTGGAGSDRFLDRSWTVSFYFYGTLRLWEDQVSDMATEDARIAFQAGQQRTFTFSGQAGSYTYAGGEWSQAEIEAVDGALGVLHRATFNDNLVERPDGGGLVFYRYGALLAATGTGGAAGVNVGDGIGLFDTAFDSGDEDTRLVVLHEVGHFWYRAYDPAGWNALSGWTDFDGYGMIPMYFGYRQGLDASGRWWYVRGTSFVSTYARTNPAEDFAESFGYYFLRRSGSTYRPADAETEISALAGKQAFLDNFLLAKVYA